MSPARSNDKVVIVGAARTPVGAIGGALKGFQAHELATFAIKEVLELHGVQPQQVEYVSAGWVCQDPRATNMAKVALERAGIPFTVPGTTIHENCASGAAAIHDITRRIMLGDIRIGIAVGAESMSNVPRLLFDGGRLKGHLYGDFTLTDGIMGALADLFADPPGALMGLLTEGVVERYGVSRIEQDEVAFRSHQNALETWEAGGFKGYVRPVTIPNRKGEPDIFAKDEGPRPISMDELAAAKPYFKRKDGTITGKNSSTINDGGAALILASESAAKELGLEPLGELRTYWNVGVDRNYMGEGAFKVIPPLLERAGLTVPDVKFFEINEAFAAVTAAAFKFIEGLKVDRVNQWGSGCSLGHPVGCTGARQAVDMVHQLRRRGGGAGVTTRCVGGGIGSGEVIVVE